MVLFWAKVNKTNSCWLWTGSRNRAGYGELMRKGIKHFAHRYAYQHLVGEIPKGLQLDHLCRVRHCVNPAHLEAVTPRENIRRGVSANRRKTHCSYGHEYSGKNLRLRVNRKYLTRECRTCDRERTRRYRLKVMKATP